MNRNVILRSFRIFVGRLSGPVELLLSNELIIFIISSGLVGAVKKVCSLG